MKSSERVLIVGNGPSVLARPIGTQVDEFDVVVRINNYVIEGFENYVGTNTDVWALAGTPRTWDYATRAKLVLLSFPLPLDDHYSRLRTLAEAVAPRLEQIDGRTFAEVMAFLGTDLTKQGTAIRHPSTGALVCWWFLNSYAHVWLHGFDHFQMTEHHYYEDRRVSEAGLQWHNPAAELDFFLRLEQGGRVSRL